MKVLVIKTSSLGDIVHALPAITEATQNISGLKFDWVVEEAFQSIPGLHPAVANVIPVAIRRWRNQPREAVVEIPLFIKRLRQRDYDLVIDSQGLMKSGLLSLLAKGKSVGFDISSIREKIATSFYRTSYKVKKGRHAIFRQKDLFAKALNYESGNEVDYGLKINREENKRIIFFHGTTSWKKEWPEKFWSQLMSLASLNGWKVVISEGSVEERKRAHRISGEIGYVIEKSSLKTLMNEFASCSAAISVDTGLGHLATAFSIPTVGIFGFTDPALTGLISPSQGDGQSVNLRCSCAKCIYQQKSNVDDVILPCYEEITPEKVWAELEQIRREPIKSDRLS